MTDLPSEHRKKRYAMWKDHHVMKACSDRGLSKFNKIPLNEKVHPKMVMPHILCTLTHVKTWQECAEVARSVMINISPAVRRLN